MWNPLDEDHITQNLMDAGCSADTVNHFLTLIESGADREQLRLLDAHRKMLLENLHLAQKRIDCLDYLIYHLEKRHDGKEV